MFHHLCHFAFAYLAGSSDNLFKVGGLALLLSLFSAISLYFPQGPLGVEFYVSNKSKHPYFSVLKIVGVFLKI